jgi:hypothetical protein
MTDNQGQYKQMNPLKQYPHGSIIIERECPYYDCSKQVCLAATGHIVPSRHQQMRYCATCDYDNCPIYLGKALRSSRTQNLDRDSILDSGK